MKTSFVLPARQRRRLRERAARAQRRDQGEVCGALIATPAGRLELRFLPNRARVAGKFSIHQADFGLVRAMLAGSRKRVVGSFHSHPVGYATPGPRDLRAGRSGSLMLIYDVRARQARLWRLRRHARNALAMELRLALERQRKSSQQPSNHALQRTHSRVTPLAGKAQASRHAARR
jgi:proteasome lid subunit RPN8/RPN11